MRVEIDQSGRVEDLGTGTAVAFSNDTRGSFFVTAGEKRKIVSFLKKNKKFSADFATIFFASLIFVLLRKHKLDRIYIDEEYTGKEKQIESFLLDLYKKGAKLGPNIRFTNIGKLSPAHRLAWLTHKHKGKNSLRVKFEEIIRFLK